MIEILFNNLAVDLFQACVILFLAHWALRWMDRKNGHRFHEMFEIIKGDPRALATYLAGRWLGICLVVTGFIIV